MLRRQLTKLCLAAVVLTGTLATAEAGDVNFSLENGQLRLTEAQVNSDNHVVFSRPSFGWLKIDCVGGTILGRPSVIIRENSVVDLIVVFGDGNDTVDFRGGRQQYRNILLDLGAPASSSSDRDLVVCSDILFSGVFSIETGPDVDDVYLERVIASRLADPSLLKVLSVYTGAGEDDVTIVDTLNVADYTIIQTYDSTRERDVDVVKFERASLDYLTLRLGGGDDTFEFRDSQGTLCYLDAGDGIDTVGMADSAMTNLTLSMGDGNDVVALLFCDFRTARAYGSTGNNDRLDYEGLDLNGGTLTRTGWEYINGRFTGNQAPFPRPTTGVFR